MRFVFSEGTGVGMEGGRVGSGNGRRWCRFGLELGVSFVVGLRWRRTFIVVLSSCCVGICSVFIRSLR